MKKSKTKSKKEKEELNNLDHSIEIKFKNRIDHHYEGFFKFIKSNYKKVLIIIFCAMLYAFGQIQFLVKAAVISDGVEAISGSLAYMFPVFQPFLTIMYLGLNIPLIIYFWKKLTKPFMITSIIFLVSNAIFGFIFGVEPINGFITHKIIVIAGPDATDIDEITHNSKLVNQDWPVFIYIILTVAFCSPTSAIVWKLGSSTGGTDLIAHYISTKKKKPVGLFIGLVGTIMASFGIIILFICKSVIPGSFKENINGFEHIISPQTISTFLYIFLNSLIINLIYPKYNKVIIKIDTKNKNEILKFLEDIHFWHPYKVKESMSGYTKDKIYSIESVVLLLESDEIAEKIKKVFPDAWISVSPISKIYGRFDYSKID